MNNNEDIVPIHVLDDPIENNIIEELPHGYTIQLITRLIDHEVVGICGISFDIYHPCNWMDCNTIINDFPTIQQENILCDDHANRPIGIILRKFFGYDTRNGGAWCDDWNTLSMSERIGILRDHITGLVDTFQSYVSYI